jgi:diaminopimelate epimerase
MRFTKMHGAGNDFIVVEAKGDERDWPQLAITLCDRHFGIGADGVLLALPSDRAAIRMRVLNPDATEPEMCGNGIRCLAKYAVERGLVRPKGGRFDIETGAGVLTVQVLGEGGSIDKVRVGMGKPRLAPAEIPVDVNAEPPLINIPVELADGVSRQVVPVTAVSMGNPHAVHFVPEPVAAFPLERLSSAFPQRHELRGRPRHRPQTHRGEGLGARCRPDARLWYRRLRDHGCGAHTGDGRRYS